MHSNEESNKDKFKRHAQEAKEAGDLEDVKYWNLRVKHEKNSKAKFLHEMLEELSDNRMLHPNIAEIKGKLERDEVDAAFNYLLKNAYFINTVFFSKDIERDPHQVKINENRQKVANRILEKLYILKPSFRTSEKNPFITYNPTLFDKAKDLLSDASSSVGHKVDNVKYGALRGGRSAVELVRSIKPRVEEAKRRYDENKVLPSASQRKALKELYISVSGNEWLEKKLDDVISDNDTTKDISSSLKDLLKSYHKENIAKGTHKEVILKAIDKFDPKFRNSSENPFKEESVAHKTVKEKAHDFMIAYKPKTKGTISSDEKDAIKTLCKELKKTGALHESKIIEGLLNDRKENIQVKLIGFLDNMVDKGKYGQAKEVLIALDKFDPAFKASKSNPLSMENITEAMFQRIGEIKVDRNKEGDLDKLKQSIDNHKENPAAMVSYLNNSGVQSEEIKKIVIDATKKLEVLDSFQNESKHGHGAKR